MNIDLIRDLARKNFLHIALEKVADALDELDERTRPDGGWSAGDFYPTEGCHCKDCERMRAKQAQPEAQGIPGCYCRECKHAQFVDEGKYWTCGLRGSPAYAVVSVPVDFGCTLGERREAE